MDCIFCKIIKKEIPSKTVYENDKVLAFYDINPAAPEHILVIPKKHIDSIDNISDGDSETIAAMLLAARDIAKEKNLNADGYRVLINNGKAAGQEVFHLHLHIFGGMKNLGPMLVK